MDSADSYFLKFEHKDFKNGIEDLVNKKKTNVILKCLA